jgi:hypothetical protein
MQQSQSFVTGVHLSPLGAASYRLLHADALTDLRPAIGKERPVTFITDIPYGETNDRPTSGIRNFGVGIMDHVDFQVAEVGQLLYTNTQARAIVFCGWFQISPLAWTFRQLKASVRVIPLIKTNPSPATSQQGIPSHEFCVVASKRGAPWYGNGRLEELRCGSPRLRVNGIRALKSARLMAHLIRYVTRPGDLVVDPFMGVGTTGEAAIRLGRHFLGIDRDPEIYSAAVSHITSLKAIRHVHTLDRRYPPLV